MRRGRKADADTPLVISVNYVALGYLRLIIIKMVRGKPGKARAGGGP